ncbi:MAG: pyridoxamine 5'-phosphate oxidase family protein [Lentisphaerae bacterium]|nr:pyridoxamine 5'-phosphate oxidase family protein [Lentisphaerota bacterium]
MATQGGGAPYTSLVAFAATPDLRHIVFPTRAGTRKFANLESEPRVALLVDNRSNTADDYRNATAVTAIGSVRIETGPGADGLRARLLARHPMLAEFLASPDCRIAAVAVSHYLLVTRFESVVRIDPCDRGSEESESQP